MEDVLGADKAEVKLRTRNVPWNKVGMSQLRRFIEHYVVPGKIRPSLLARHYLAAAILCHANGLKDAAHSYAEKAVNASAYIQADVNRLLPAD